MAAALDIPHDGKIAKTTMRMPIVYRRAALPKPEMILDEPDPARRADGDLHDPVGRSCGRRSIAAGRSRGAFVQ